MSICGQKDSDSKKPARVCRVSPSSQVPAGDDQYKVEWTTADLALLRELEADDARLPPDAPRALLSVRLSVFTDETTSPARQELDLRLMARERGHRVAGVASDLNVSATKKPPWKRPQLGDWLGNRTPEFDAIFFWKLDRFIRRMSDLHRMISWCQKYQKNLVSRDSQQDKIDLDTPVGQLLATFFGYVAEIEAANTRARVESLWDYTKTQSDWKIGKPPYGYRTQKLGDARTLVPDEKQVRALHAARDMLVSDGVSMRQAVRDLASQGLMSEGLTVATLARRLRNPALLGYRVEEEKGAGYRRSKLVYDRDGAPITVATEPIFTESEFQEIQSALDKRRKGQPARQPGGATKFLGVLKCDTCESGMTVQNFTNKSGRYSYLRCQKCPSGGLGAPNPDAVYASLATTVLNTLGDRQVERREYARGEAREAETLQEQILYYMRELAPGGRYARTSFTLKQGQETYDRLVAQYEAMDPDLLEDRWVYVSTGETFRQRWDEGGIDGMADDLVRAGIDCLVTRTKVPGARAPQVSLRLRLPEDVQDRLLLREDEFAPGF